MKRKIAFSDYMKAVKSADREMEQDIYGVGFKSKHKIHKSFKNYTRKIKHKINYENNTI